MELSFSKDIDSDLRAREVSDQIGIPHSGFARKVFSLIGTQVLLTAAIVAVFMSTPTLAIGLFENWWLIFPTMLVFIVTALVPACCKDVGRKVPTNYAILYTFVSTM